MARSCSIGSSGAPDPSRSDPRTPTGSSVSRRRTNDRTRAEGGRAIARHRSRGRPAGRPQGSRSTWPTASETARGSGAPAGLVARAAARGRAIGEGQGQSSKAAVRDAGQEVAESRVRHPRSDSAARVTSTRALVLAPRERPRARAWSCRSRRCPGGRARPAPSDPVEECRDARSSTSPTRRPTGSGCSHPDDASALQGPRYRRAPRALVHRVRATTNRP